MVNRKFDINFASEIIEIGNEFILVEEASGEVANRWQNETSKRAVLSNGQVQTVRDAADLAPMLISLCSKYCDSAGDVLEPVKNVPQSVICSWPNRVQKALFELILDISGLTPSEEDLGE